MHFSASTILYYYIHLDNNNIVSVPEGLKSTESNVQLKVTITNQRTDSVSFWWVDYSGNPVY